MPYAPDDAAQRLADRALEVGGAGGEGGGDQVRDDLGVGLRAELDAVGDQLGAQLVRVLDDPVVHDGDPAGGVRVRVRVVLGRLTVGRPARVPDARRPLEPGGQPGDEVGHPALRLADLEAAPGDDRDTRGVVAAVLQASQPLEEDRGGVLRADVADDAAHSVVPLPN